MSSRKYRSLCRSGQHSGPVRSGRKAFFSACAASREKRRQKGSVMPRGEPASGERRRASGPRDALHLCPDYGAGRMRKIVSISACCAAPCRTVGKKGAALPEHCRITV